MRHRQRNRESHSYKNRAYVFMIASGYALSGANLIVASFCSVIDNEIISRYLVFIGIVMSIMVPISLLDNRKKMRGKLAAGSSLAIHLIVCCMLAFLCSYQWLLVYLVEALIVFLQLLMFKAQDKEDDSD